MTIITQTKHASIILLAAIIYITMATLKTLLAYRPISLVLG